MKAFFMLFSFFQSINKSFENVNVPLRMKAKNKLNGILFIEVAKIFAQNDVKKANVEWDFNHRKFWVGIKLWCF